jgi:hypothetical protein
VHLGKAGYGHAQQDRCDQHIQRFVDLLQLKHGYLLDNDSEPLPEPMRQAERP